MKAQFGRYVFLKKLAVGGMAEIFLARRLSFGGFARFVVLKRLLPEHRGRPAYERLFLGEARISALLDHPHVISLHDLGQLDDAYFMAMEYVHGISGAELMAAASRGRTAVPLGVALRVVTAAAEALHYCAEGVDLDGKPFGVIHHDVSPHNIQVGFDGAVKLLDFGVATQVGKPSPAGRRGKFAYMSPEAIAKEELDPRTDVYSLGVVLYELTVGRRLFKGATPDETRAKAEQGDFKRPSEVSRDFPPMLEAIVLKALARDRRDRYQTAQELAFDLANVVRALRTDTTAEATAAWLTGLMGPEIERRRHELYALALASSTRRTAPTEASVSQLDPSRPPSPLRAEEDGEEDAPTMVAELPAGFGRPEPSEPPPPMPEDGREEGGAEDASELRVAEEAARQPEPPPPPEEPAGPELSTGDFVLPVDAVSPDHDWDDGIRRGMGGMTILFLVLLALGAAVGAFFAGGHWATLQADASQTGTLRVESEPSGAVVESSGRQVGTTPWDAPPTALGTVFHLRVSRDGYEDWQGTVSLVPERRNRALQVVLRKSKANP